MEEDPPWMADHFRMEEDPHMMEQDLRRKAEGIMDHLLLKKWEKEEWGLLVLMTWDLVVLMVIQGININLDQNFEAKDLKLELRWWMVGRDLKIVWGQGATVLSLIEVSQEWYHPQT